ncbi:MAG: sulfurtransferase TusA family protein [Gammaproteobacteria bacterium]|nr:sulfurtransferase TusA family protein [Gammaproteobacteria bacterium]
MLHKVDARRLLCPLPVIRLQDKVNVIALGDQVEILCTDPGVKNDIPAWCKINGQRIDSMIEQANEIIITVSKLSDA